MCDILNEFFCSDFTEENVNNLPWLKMVFLDDVRWW